MRSFESDEGSFESDRDSFDSDTDSFHTAIAPEDVPSMSSEDRDSISSQDSFYSVYSAIDGDSEDEVSLRESLIPILPIGARRCNERERSGATMKSTRQDSTFEVPIT